MTTIEEKQKELDALQTAFDEYIVSSRELEEELDDELTKCRELNPTSLFIFIFNAVHVVADTHMYTIILLSSATANYEHMNIIYTNSKPK